MNEDDRTQVNKELLDEVFRLANMEPPEEVTDDAFFDALFKLKNTIAQGGAAQSSENELGAIDQLAQMAQNQMNDMLMTENHSNMSNNILVIDDIGVVTYQLKILFKNLGYNVEVARDIFSGINAFIKTNYAYVIMDLFVSTEQEGYTLLNETKKIITKNNLKTKIIVITASSKAENKVKCLNGGADIFLKKDMGWQDKLIEIIENMH